ncbi:hypothetical protein L6164_034972 [Bauhinia variegata]|uniref:Uncharacterized protein n=1 Tax=Bauhinia variegata TaxID=167791 RepID=A0ACB9KXW6_BAUVA|nr:hypothetical protein L6164_034972 [Bauhinia variegata]
MPSQRNKAIPIPILFRTQSAVPFPFSGVESKLEVQVQESWTSSDLREDQQEQGRYSCFCAQQLHKNRIEIGFIHQCSWQQSAIKSLESWEYGIAIMPRNLPRPEPQLKACKRTLNYARGWCRNNSYSLPGNEVLTSQKVPMRENRKSDREGDDRNPEIPVEHSKRRYEESEVQIPMCVIGNLRIVVTSRALNSSIGGLVRRLVREALQRHSLTVHHIGTSGTKPIQLRFANKVASTYTRSQIKSEEDEFIRIELMDARSQSVITVGDLASKKIKLYVLKGEFGSEDWSDDQFDDNILPPREGREPLLKGEILINLQNGVATIRNLELTDNSRWTRTGKFRLGARVAGSTPHGEDIREGISEPFRVKEKRGKDRKKRNRPSSRSVAGEEAGQRSGTDQDLQQNFLTAHQDQLETFPDFGQPSTSTMYDQFNPDSLAGSGGILPQHGCVGGGLLTGTYNIEENHWTPIGSEFPVAPDSYSTWVSSGDFNPCNGAEFGIRSSFHNSCMDISKTRRVWYKIKNAFKWVNSVRREAAAKRRIRGKAILP